MSDSEGRRADLATVDERVASRVIAGTGRLSSQGPLYVWEDSEPPLSERIFRVLLSCKPGLDS